MRRNGNLRLLLGASAALLLLTDAPARADYLSETGMIQIIAPPPSVKRGDLMSDAAIRTFAEHQQFTLSTAVSVDDTAPGTFQSNASLVGGTVAAGTKVDSYFFHSDPASASMVYVGSVTFTSAILGVIVLSGSLDATDSQLGHPGTSYPTGDAGRGLDLSPTEDYFTLSADKMTLTFRFSTHDNVDEVRVLTAPTPEPASAALLGLGIVGIAGLARRRRRDPKAA